MQCVTGIISSKLLSTPISHKLSEDFYFALHKGAHYYYCNILANSVDAERSKLAS